MSPAAPCARVRSWSRQPRPGAVSVGTGGATLGVGRAPRRSRPARRLALRCHGVTGTTGTVSSPPPAASPAHRSCARRPPGGAGARRELDANGVAAAPDAVFRGAAERNPHARHAETVGRRRLFEPERRHRPLRLDARDRVGDGGVAQIDDQRHRDRAGSRYTRPARSPRSPPPVPAPSRSAGERVRPPPPQRAAGERREQGRHAGDRRRARRDQKPRVCGAAS